MRKLTREAAIFALLTPLAVVVISFVGLTFTTFPWHPPVPRYAPLLLGVLGFPAGLIIWSLYRLIRFAVKG